MNVYAVLASRSHFVGKSFISFIHPLTHSFVQSINVSGHVTFRRLIESKGQRGQPDSHITRMHLRHQTRPVKRKMNSNERVSNNQTQRTQYCSRVNEREAGGREVLMSGTSTIPRVDWRVRTTVDKCEHQTLTASARHLYRRIRLTSELITTDIMPGTQCPGRYEVREDVNIIIGVQTTSCTIVVA